MRYEYGNYETLKEENE